MHVRAHRHFHFALTLVSVLLLQSCLGGLKIRGSGESSKTTVAGSTSSSLVSILSTAKSDRLTQFRVEASSGLSVGDMITVLENADINCNGGLVKGASMIESLPHTFNITNPRSTSKQVSYRFKILKTDSSTACTSASTYQAPILENVTQLAISSGNAHACALKADGTVWCWGNNSSYQLGDSTTTHRTIPVNTGLANAQGISASGSGSCAIVSGALKCWGGGSAGMTDLTGFSGVPTQIVGSLGGGCAIVTGNTVQCWGSNTAGQMGNGVIGGSYATPQTVPGVSNAQKISMGNATVCAIETGGVLKCWGGNTNGSVGNGTNTNVASPFTVPIANVVDVAAGNTTCAVINTGAVYCFGAGTLGQIGDGTTVSKNVPTLSLATGVSKVAAGASFICAVKTDKTALCWGYGEYGQLGNLSNVISVSTPTAVQQLSGVDSILAASDNACALLDDQTVKCWGINRAVLGDGLNITNNNTTDMIDVSSIQDAIHITTGEEFGCAILLDGSVKCWGDNYYGQIGQGHTTYDYYSPVAVPGMTNVVHIKAGWRHVCAVKSNGTVWCWGDGWDGELGDGAGVRSSTPVQVTGINTAVKVTLGEYHSCALLSDETIRCWGGNYYGSLGNGNSTLSNVPVAAAGGITGVKEVSAGAYTTCVRLTNGSVKCVGQGTGGQLGNSASANSLTWVDVTGITDATQLAAGRYHHCILRATGAVVCFGGNSAGQLGDGTLVAKNSPTTIAALSSGVSHISAHEELTCAVLSTGRMKCFGRNNYKTLGDGTVANRSSPVDVLGVTGAVQSANGYYLTCARLKSGTLKCWGANWDGLTAHDTAMLPSHVLSQ